MTVVLVAAPLMARSGVYNSLFDLVECAREAGLPWEGRVGVRPDAPGPQRHNEFVTEQTVVKHGLSVIPEVYGLMKPFTCAGSDSFVITMITQSDVAAALHGVGSRRRRDSWVAYIRGLPWPAEGEQSRIRRLALKALEAASLKVSREVWASTPVLAEDISPTVSSTVIPAGIRSIPRSNFGQLADGEIVWAGRLDVDKDPQLFVDACTEVGRRGVLYGDGPLKSALEDRVSWWAELAGWADMTQVWPTSSLYLGTSKREAFGRSAVEAALAGVPMVIGRDYGAAEYLITDPQLASICIVASRRPADWAESIQTVLSDPGLMRAISDHVHENAQALTVEASVNAVQARLNTLGDDQRLTA